MSGLLGMLGKVPFLVWLVVGVGFYLFVLK